MTSPKPILAAVLLLGIVLAGVGWLVVAAAPPSEPTTASPPQVSAQVRVHHRETVEGLGACQGIAVHDGSVWLYGDADTGVIRRFTWVPPTEDRPPRLEPAGETLRLTVHGPEGVDPVERHVTDLVAHPTGLTFHPEFGCFLGNTVRQKGTIFHVDWPKLLRDGELTHAVLHRVDDDLAVNGTRPEFVRFRGRWLVATSDYGPTGNTLRLYDPVTLRTAERTSEPGVLVAAFPCGPFVQTLHWLDGPGVLVLVQNRAHGRGYRLTFVDLDTPTGLRDAQPLDLADLDGELEGFALVAPEDDGGWFVMSAAQARPYNITYGRLILGSREN